MAEGNLRDDDKKFGLVKTILNARRQCRWMQQHMLNTVIVRKRLLLKVFSFILLLVSVLREPAASCCINDHVGVSKGTLAGGT